MQRPYIHRTNANEAFARLDFNDVSPNEIRIVGNLVHDRVARAYHGITGSLSADLCFPRVMRGDAPLEEHSMRLYTGKFEDRKDGISILIPGMSTQELEQDTFGADMAPNRKGKPGLLPTMVRALTVDGRGGQLDWDEDAPPQACLWFFIERAFAAHPHEGSIAFLRGRKGSKKRGDYKSWTLPGNFKEIQERGFNRWLKETYLPGTKTSVTHCPITERYFLQLQRTGMSHAKKDDLGEAFFGEYTYRVLQGKRRQIRAAQR